MPLATCRGPSGTTTDESSCMTEELAIVHAVRRATATPFDYLVERYKDVLYGTACLMTGSRTHAEDYVQEALLSAWRGIRWVPARDCPFKPWLVRILVNEVLSQRRRRSLPYPAGFEDEDHGTEESIGPGRSRAATQDDRRAVRTCADRPHHRAQTGDRPALLCGAHHVTEMAQSLNVREGTVKSQAEPCPWQLCEEQTWSPWLQERG